MQFPRVLAVCADSYSQELRKTGPMTELEKQERVVVLQEHKTDEKEQRERERARKESDVR